MRFRNSSGTAQSLPHLELPHVPPGGEFDATGDDAKSLQSNPSFERVDKPKTSEKE